MPRWRCTWGRRTPAQFRPALEAIKTASKDSLAEIRQLLGVLREDAPLTPAPPPRLDRLPGLADDARRAGLEVSLTQPEAAVVLQLPDAVQEAAYRIVQEALTNVVRHSGARKAAVVLALEGTTPVGNPGRQLTVTVDDDGAGAAGDARRQRGDGDAGEGGRRRRFAALRAVEPGAAAAGLAGPGRDTGGGAPGRTPAGAGTGGAVIRILLADDQNLIRAGFRALLNAEPDMEVVAECGTGRDAVRLAAREQSRRGADGHPHARDRRAGRHPADHGRSRAWPGTRIIILTTFELDEYIAEAVRAGAAGFLVKDTEPEELLRAVRVVHDGDALLSPSVTRRIMAQLALQSRAAAAPGRWSNITEREREVLRLVGEGLNNAEIAERLVITPLTAKTHVSRIMTKLLVRDRAQLVVLAYESGLVRPGWAG